MKYVFLLSLLLVVGNVFSQKNITRSELQNGDLLFVGVFKESLSGAINRVTQRNDKQMYDHVAILEKTPGSTFYVLESSPKKGSVREILDSFYLPKKDNRLIAVYRLYPDYQYSIPKAITQAKQLLGKPYNWSYVLNENSYYCSDFVERAFRFDTVFHLEPMTFVNPKTGKIDDYWVQFYKKQKMEVPQGKLGCNPNGLAASSKLFLVGFLNGNPN